MGAIMGWRLFGRPRLSMGDVMTWLGAERPADIHRQRARAEAAIAAHPHDPLAHIALATALIAAVRSGVTDDRDEDAALAIHAARRALALKPREPMVRALAAVAIAHENEVEARGLVETINRRELQAVPRLVEALQDGLRRPAPQ